MLTLQTSCGLSNFMGQTNPIQLIRIQKMHFPCIYNMYIHILYINYLLPKYSKHFIDTRTRSKISNHNLYIEFFFNF